MKDWTEEERELFLESRRLKEKARGLVARRKAREADIARKQELWRREAEEAKRLVAKQAEEVKKLADKQAMDKRDERIRYFLIDAAKSAKFSKLAFENSPAGMIQHAFTLIDLDRDSPTFGCSVKINTTANGFEWK